MRWLAVCEDDIPSGDEWLSAAERARQDRMRFTKRRTEYRLRRYAGKRAVAVALGLADRLAEPSRLAGVELLNRPGGAPFVRLDGQDAAVDVSLTDRAGWAVCLVGPEGTMASGTLGVDLEIVEDRSATFVADYFTPAERAFIHGCGTPGSDGWAWSANLLWSAKEAALKVLRVGLRADTRSVEVSLDLQPRADGWAALSVEASSGEVFPGWWRRDGSYLLTLAAREPHQPPTLLGGGSDLAHGIPTHSWIGRPLVE